MKQGPRVVLTGVVKSPPPRDPSSLDEEPSQELKAFIILPKEHNVVLLHLLEGLDKLSSHCLDLLFCGQKLLVLLQSQLPLCPQIVL